MRTKEKKDGFDWIVDLKLSKKLKGKWEKKDGFCQVVYLKCKRQPKKKREKKDGCCRVVDLKCKSCCCQVVDLNLFRKKRMDEIMNEWKNE